MNATVNGQARKSLAQQIDKLELLLDGLAEGLNDAIAAAVEQAVKATLSELLPHLQPPAVPVPEAKPTILGKVAEAGTKVWTWMKGKAKAAGQIVAKAVQPVAQVAVVAKEAVQTVAGKVGQRVMEGVAVLGLLRRVLTGSATMFGLGVVVGGAAAMSGSWLVVAAGLVVPLVRWR
jgi:hypothetical protein